MISKNNIHLNQELSSKKECLDKIKKTTTRTKSC